MDSNEGFPQDGGLFVKLWAAVCRVTGWKCRCPRCGGEMEREMALDEVYVIHRRRPESASRARMANSPLIATSMVEITPVYDQCKRCGHRIRRPGVKTPLD